MEFGRSIPRPKENSFEIEGFWIPATPAKPEQRNRPPRPQWVNSGAYQRAETASNGASAAEMQMNSGSAAFVADQVPDLDRWKAAMAAQSQVSSLNSYMGAFENSAERWRNMPFAHLLAFTDASAAARMEAGSNAASLRSAISYPHVDGAGGGNWQQQSNPAADLLRIQQAVGHGSTPSSNNRACGAHQMPQYGFPVPYHGNYNHSYLDTVTNGSSFQLAPLTPDPGSRVQTSQTVETAGLSVNERSIHEKENVENLPPCISVNPQANVDNQGLLQSMYSISSIVPSTPIKEIHNPSNREGLGEISPAANLSTPVENHTPNAGNEQNIDLNKTPQQKPKRKKHRPKVIREGKPKRTPKQATPNQSENPSGKRKYVRKAGPKTSASPADAQETIKSNGETRVRSCKRQLNFDIESRAEDGHPRTIQVHQGTLNRSTSDSFGVASCTRALNLDAVTQYHDQCAGINHFFGSKSTLQVDQGQKVVAGNSSAGIAFDLNHCITQAQDDHISLPENANPYQTIAREERSMEHINSLDMVKNMASIVRHRDYAHMHQNVYANEIDCRINLTVSAHDNHPSIEPSRLKNGLPPVNENQYNLNSRSHVLLGETNHTQRGSKRENDFTVDETHLRTMKLYAAQRISREACQRIQHNKYYLNSAAAQGIYFSENYKRMRTVTGNNELTSNVMLPVPVRDDRARQATPTTVSEILANQLMLQTSDGRSFPLFNVMEGNKKPQNGTCYTVHDVNSQSMTGKQNPPVANISREVLSRLNAQRGINLNGVQASKRSMGMSNIESTMSGRLNRPVLMNKLASLTAAAVECGRLPATSLKTALTYNDRQVSSIFCTPQARMETLGADNYGKMKTNESTKELVHLAHSMSYGTNQVYLQEQKAPVRVYHQSCMESRVTTPVKQPIGPTVSLSKHSQLRTSQTVPTNFIHDCQSSRSIKRMLGASSRSKVIAPRTDPVDEIVERLIRLNINGDSKIVTAQAESALIPYGGDRKMVPYKGPFEPIQKRHSRPKVDLDPETDRVWKLLMWKGGDDGTEEMNAGKEKWWEEERRVFRGRADSFIARMHLVQGDRRFSPWKGSVVDSVVGVFLTQNVSDQLSSSAFMALAAKFPLKPRGTTHNGEEQSACAEEQDVSILDSDDSIKQQSKISSQKVHDRGSIRIQEVNPLEEKEMASSNESIGSNMGACTANCTKGKHLAACQIGSEICQGSSENKADIEFTMRGNASLTGVENRKAMEDVVSSQVSVISSQNSTESIVQATDTIGSSSESNSEAENTVNRFECNDLEGFTSFLDLLQMEGKNLFSEFYVNGNESMPSKENFDGASNQLKGSEYDRVECPKGSGPSNSTTTTHHFQQEFEGIVGSRSNGNHMHIGPRSGSVDLESVEASGEESRSSFPSTTSEIPEVKDNHCTGERINAAAEHLVDYEFQRKSFSNAQTTLKGDLCVPPSKHPVHPSPASDAKPHTHLDAAECSSFLDKQTIEVSNIAEPSLKDEVCSSKNVSNITTKTNLKERRGMNKADKKRDFDWDSLRKQACFNGPKKERSSNTMDSVDWEAIRCADVKEIAHTIRERGMNNMLSERIKDFLNRLVKDHGSIDLEWLRDVPPDKTKDYLLSIRGLGLKSVECVRLLTLHHLAFPVDTNVGRICVRLGWVPLQPLPESLQLHLLELYPLLETIQKYLWPRLCTLDQRTLYELHYQMITFGKVFCTKSKPNCNACPMRGECKHFASAFASARLALPGPEEKRLVSSVVPANTNQGHKLNIHLMPLPPIEENSHSQAGSRIIQCEPIIEEPATPEPECIDTSESAIEDAFWTDDPDEIPTIKLNIEEFTQNVQNYVQGNSELQDVDMSKALVALTQEAASIPMPKLKNISRLRTEHQVYELPDTHPLLAELDRREPDDPCPYLLAIWTPGETAQSINPPEFCCDSKTSSNLCSKKTCFTCNSIREENAQTVRGTLLIPCRTAMRGSFPLNGTYFQVNEVFADHDSSLQPINVPRQWIWNLPRRTVYFGTSISTIFKGLTTEGIQQCFWRGFVCVRGFEQKTRAPRPLMARLHFPASKLVGTKKNTAEAK